jgi:pimeloyl-ACP methyl ester carboxylesterase
MAASSEAVRLSTASGTIAGTLELPARTGPVPVVLIISGSGPTDRNGNSPVIPGANNSLKMLADGLAQHGIASVRFDKRGIGESQPAGPSEADLRFDTYVDDAAAWVKQLRADPRFSTITILGHSEGSLIGMIATGRSGADAFVSIAGIGRRAGEIIHDQLAPQLPPEMMAQSDRVIASLNAGHTDDSAPPALAALFRPSVQPYLISWFRYDPAVEIARLQVPVLVVQGTTDIQVPVSEADILRRARPDAKSLIIPGMNHILKHVVADRAINIASYSDPSLPIVQELVAGVASFVSAAVPRRVR